MPVLDHNIGTLGGCVVAFVPHAVLNTLIADFPRIGAAFWRDTLVDASITREWLLNVGARNAYDRLAHLVCEVYTRLQVVGRTDGLRFNFPISQAAVAEATGISVVHVNRTMQALRKDGLFSLRNGMCEVSNWQALERASQFDAKYLHLYQNGKHASAER